MMGKIHPPTIHPSILWVLCMSEDERFAYGGKKICPYGNILFAPCQMREYPMPREEEEDYVTLLCGGFLPFSLDPFC